MDLPDDLVLPLRSGAPHWYWLGGRPALDLVNTLRERWWRRVETLVTPDDLGGWLAAAELVVAAPSATAAELEAARGLREAIEAGVTATLAGAPVPAQTSIALAAALGAAPPCEHVTVDADGAVAVHAGRAGSATAQALAAVALDAATMFGATERGRIRVCASDTCSARFFDRSPAGRRRWCSMQTCGNVEKARRHRRRERSERQEML